MNEIFCEFCGDGRLFIARGEIYERVNGNLLNIKDVEFLKCEFCGEKIFTASQLKQKKRRILQEYKKILGLLSCEEIKNIRKSFNLKQKEFGEILGCGKVSLSRWEGEEQVQSKLVDNFLRVIKEFPEVLDFLKNRVNGSPKK